MLSKVTLLAKLHKGGPMKRRLLMAAVFAAGALFAAPAMAQDRIPGADRGTGGDVQKEKKIEMEVIRGPNGRKKIIIKTPMELFASVQRPSAFYLLERTPLNTRVTPLEKGFTNRILESVRKNPF